MRTASPIAAQLLLAALVASAAGFWNLPMGVCCMPAGEAVNDCGACCHHSEGGEHGSEQDPPAACECDQPEAASGDGVVVAPLPSGLTLRLPESTWTRCAFRVVVSTPRPPDLPALQRWLC